MTDAAESAGDETSNNSLTGKDDGLSPLVDSPPPIPSPLECGNVEGGAVAMSNNYRKRKGDCVMEASCSSYWLPVLTKTTLKLLENYYFHGLLYYIV